MRSPVGSRRRDGAAPALSLRAGLPRVVAPPGAGWRATGRCARPSATPSTTAGRPRALVPALVVGDDSAVDELAADFRTTGLTHLLAVSGTNLTLAVGFLLLAGRWVRVRGRGH